MKSFAIRVLTYFALLLGWIFLYAENPELTSNTAFVYQEF